MSFLKPVIAAAAILMALPVSAAVDIEEVKTPAGLTLWLVEERSFPVVTVEALIRGGSSLDPEGQAGVATFAMGLMDEGAGELDSTAFARAREALAAQFGVSANRDTVSISFKSLTENLGPAADLLHSALTEPRFDPEAVERVREQIMSGLRSAETDPQELASRAFFSATFGEHPYARPGDGTMEGIASIGADDLRAAHRRLLVRDRLHVSVVGDIDAEAAAALVDRLFADLPLSNAPLPASVQPDVPQGVSVIELPTPQSTAYFGHAGIPRDDPDFFAAYVMNHILGGGGFSSRLTEEVREKRGLTYGVGAYLAPLDHGPLYLGSVASANGTIAEAIEVIRAEWRRMAENGATEEELDAAKRYLTGAYPLRFDSNARIADGLVGLQEGELGIDYINTRNDKINDVTLEDVARVAKRILRPDDLYFVVVGQPEGLDTGSN